MEGDILVNREAIGTAETKVRDARVAFEEAWTAAKAAWDATMGVGWKGAAAEAFNGRIAEASTNFNGVMAQIDGIAEMLRAGRDGIVTADEQMATGMLNG